LLDAKAIFLLDDLAQHLLYLDPNLLVFMHFCTVPVNMNYQAGTNLD
jgi:hypothetical protein